MDTHHTRRLGMIIGSFCLLLLLGLLAQPYAAQATPTHDPNARVRGIVWNDLNGNGIHDPGEPGLRGVTLHLMYVGPDGIPYTSDDRLIQSTSSGGAYDTFPEGQYSFTWGGGNNRYYIAILNRDKPAGFTTGPFRPIADPNLANSLHRPIDTPLWATDTFVIGEYPPPLVTGFNIGLVPLVLEPMVYLPLVIR